MYTENKVSRGMTQSKNYHSIRLSGFKVLFSQSPTDEPKSLNTRVLL